MKVLIRIDESEVQEKLAIALSKWGHETVLANGNDEAWDHFQSEEPPSIGLFEWTEDKGAELCRENHARALE